MAARGPDWLAWVDELPKVAQSQLAEWELTPDGEPAHGFASIVLPVRASGGAPAVLKIGFPDVESEHEHLALRRWGGDGAVRLLRAEPRRRAMLLERLHRRDLNELWDVEACEVIAGLYQRIHVPALAPLLWNRWDELAGDIREGVRRRFYAVVDAAGLAEDRARAWVVVRMVHNAMWELQNGPAADRAWLTMCVAIAKAVQD
jgi:Aminoglycoside/hydroxyurea antibiotic resistance kinase